MSKRMAVVLAAGKGTRMKSSLYKVLHPVCGLPMVEHVIRAVKASQVEEIVTIIGHGAQQVKEVLGDASRYAMQEEQLGTGHAVLQAAELLADQEGQTLVICGDTPLFTAETLSELFAQHEARGAQATVLTAILADATGYGRIVRSAQDDVERIVEHKDATEEQRQIKEINTGTFVFDNQALFKALAKVTNQNAQGEYYLTDVIELIKADGGLVGAHVMADHLESLGVNDRRALSQANQIMSRRINQAHMVAGVSFMNPDTVYIETDVTIGPDTVIENGVLLKGKTSIGSSCYIGANTEIVDSQIADQVKITQSVIESSTVAEGATVGPFAHLRPKSYLGKDVHIGNFVEVKNSTIGQGTKSGHLTYIGDADLGEGINIGCGTIFVNYDGKRKFRSKVGDQAFIGCNANIVSPVEIGQRAFIAAGATITNDVPDEALAISRVEQSNISNYWQKFLNK
ncbi:bifunctional UDP-N-acetylglucosamine diphosphorylase/glucosamine-1-phosphate N-acetyltransferase GlmU [Vaginisenegalia massiliensis]|uniref:bifunctional UDP-N-acetylglucosamine diphosphorylase/glucosamine-1-phosphate N-acetyltransferase GlmU n=1 Tax=Vaginisenegalia massiliensis TaxID=2058294 RepID=UPI000F527A9F|nr:bifunctional UDP-N-acetylglucosamine diphosphorylase/glucosamine-1-phosphate N-acetyltransferase GlmU [Vaginisenegalia massiliensis]